jgi:hypothetical protein
MLQISVIYQGLKRVTLLHLMEQVTALFLLGGTTGNVIDYVTISTTGNATNFGNLITARRYIAATSNGINDRGVIGGGYNDDV